MARVADSGFRSSGSSLAASRRATLQPQRQSGSSTTEGHVEAQVEEQLRRQMEQNAVLAKRNAIFSSRITELENTIQSLREEIVLLKRTCELERIVDALEENLTTNFNASLSHLHQVRLTHGLRLRQKKNSNSAHEVVAPELPAANAVFETPMDNSRAQSGSAQFQRQSQSQSQAPPVNKEKKKESFTVPLYFKKTDDGDFNKKLSSLLESSDAEDADAGEVRSVGPFAFEKKSPGNEEQRSSSLFFPRPDTNNFEDSVEPRDSWDIGASEKAKEKFHKIRSQQNTSGSGLDEGDGDGNGDGDGDEGSEADCKESSTPARGKQENSRRFSPASKEFEHAEETADRTSHYSPSHQQSASPSSPAAKPPQSGNASVLHSSANSQKRGNLDQELNQLGSAAAAETISSTGKYEADRADHDPPHEARRSTRVKKEVNYKPMAGNTKMRRDSVHMRDAVGDNVFYVSHAKEERSKARDESQEPSAPRKPLANLTNTQGSPSKTEKPKKKRPKRINELSIFDFDSEYQLPGRKKRSKS
ncbi:uncharacterized protein LODBEIA_P04740 [Lodderomyces beijingensis]|uniref:Shugoshin C-terminal domain-containing protein n=1 Tax=Lodderomyces beijingensis TaxID=1775926 RepID=A0ABP0ZDJ8_9ASCO